MEGVSAFPVSFRLTAIAILAGCGFQLGAPLAGAEDICRVDPASPQAGLRDIRQISAMLPAACLDRPAGAAISMRVGTLSESQCGRHVELEHVRFAGGPGTPAKEFTDRFSKPVGMLKWRADMGERLSRKGYQPGNLSGLSWCSGSLIGPDLFLTAFHCVESSVGRPFRLPAKAGRPLDPEELALNMEVVMGRQLGDNCWCESAETFRVAGIAARSTPNRTLREGEDDFVVLRLAPGPDGLLPGDSRKYGQLKLSPRKPRPGERISIIQHPFGSLKMVGHGSIYRPASRRSGRFPDMEYANIDTSRKSSGAPILDRSGKVIGVHSRGGCDRPGMGNFGFSIHRMARNSAGLRELIQ